MIKILFFIFTLINDLLHRESSIIEITRYIERYATMEGIEISELKRICEIEKLYEILKGSSLKMFDTSAWIRRQG